mmetsp:Transcript_56997/g.135971  ORF Transcript_56997/g.135971 Transcript_56997/m.135971 type:complete len:286 (-) Transcript_56997:229-1086(-)
MEMGGADGMDLVGGQAHDNANAGDHQSSAEVRRLATTHECVAGVGAVPLAEGAAVKRTRSDVGVESGVEDDDGEGVASTGPGPPKRPRFHGGLGLSELAARARQRVQVKRSTAQECLAKEVEDGLVSITAVMRARAECQRVNRILDPGCEQTAVALRANVLNLGCSKQATEDIVRKFLAAEHGFVEGGGVSPSTLFADVEDFLETVPDAPSWRSIGRFENGDPMTVREAFTCGGYLWGVYLAGGSDDAVGKEALSMVNGGHVNPLLLRRTHVGFSDAPYSPPRDP